MRNSLQKWLFVSLLIALLVIPFPAGAQENVTLESATVQLWPEFDQPTMLVILSVQLAPNISLPAELTFQLPGNVDKPFVVAVGPTAQTVSDQNIDYTSQKNGDWLEVMVTAEYPAIQIEYYDSALMKEEENRSFTYEWPGTYATDELLVSFRVPIDTTDIITDPEMRTVTPAGSGQTFLEWSTSGLEVGEQVPIYLSYIKTSDSLSVSNQPLETGIVDESTEGRVSLSNYLPYIFGGLGVLLILAGGLYFWQTGQRQPRQRRRHRTSEKAGDEENVYCHQCGKRAQANDRFCRTCGTRLRKET